MNDADYRQQQGLEEERENLSLEILYRVARGQSDMADAMFLASELGLTRVFKSSTLTQDITRT